MNPASLQRPPSQQPPDGGRTSSSGSVGADRFSAVSNLNMRVHQAAERLTAHLPRNRGNSHPSGMAPPMNVPVEVSSVMQRHGREDPLGRSGYGRDEVDAPHRFNSKECRLDPYGEGHAAEALSPSMHRDMAGVEIQVRQDGYPEQQTPIQKGPPVAHAQTEVARAMDAAPRPRGGSSGGSFNVDIVGPRLSSPTFISGEVGSLGAPPRPADRRPAGLQESAALEAARDAQRGASPMRHSTNDSSQRRTSKSRRPYQVGGVVENGNGAGSSRAGGDNNSQAQAARSPEAWQKQLEENNYLRRNVENLRNVKHDLQRKLRGLDATNQLLQGQVDHYKAAAEQAQRFAQGNRGTDGMEILNLQDQLSAVVLMKDALNKENLELQRRLEEEKNKSQAHASASSASCVVCMDNLANLVCLPCKHLALCIDCGSQENLRTCPICRADLIQKMQIYPP